MLSATSSNLTEGKISRQLRYLAIPLLIGGLFQQLYNTVDSIVIGRWLGQTAFAASGLAGVLLNVCIFLLTGCCAGVAIFLAKIYGSRQEERFRREVFLSGWMGLLFSLSLSAISLTILPRVLRAMNTPPEALQLATTYLNIILGGLPLTFLYNFLASILRAVGDTKRALYFLILANLLNSALDVLFLGALKYDISGAAWSTIFSQGTSALLCWILLRRRYRELLPQRKDVNCDSELAKDTIYYASISALQASALCLGNLLVQKGINTLGISGIAAYAAATRLEGIIKTFAASGAVALGLFVAQNEGAMNLRRSRQAFLCGVRDLSLFGIFAGAILYFCGAPLLSLFLGNADAQTIEWGTSYLQLIAFCYAMPFLANAYQGWFRGRGRLVIPFAGTAIQLSIRAFVVLNFLPQRGLEFVAIATILGWICMLIFLAIADAKTYVTSVRDIHSKT